MKCETLLLVVTAMTSSVMAASFSAPRGLLFHASFDGYSTTAEFAQGPASACAGIPAELQLRMHPDVRENGKGNALTLTTPEYLSYPIPSNMRLDRGTVSFWVCCKNYAFNGLKWYNMLFTAEYGDMLLLVYRYGSTPNELSFYIRNKGQMHLVRAKAPWKEGEWHKVDAVWDPNGMALYIDGQSGGRIKGDQLPSISIDPPEEFPRNPTGGRFSLNSTQGWIAKEGQTTAFDEVRLYDRKLSATEIYQAFAEERPDLAANIGKPVANEAEAIKLTYTCHPDQQQLDVRLDFDAVGVLHTNAIPVRLALVDKRSRATVVATETAFPNAYASAPLVFGEKLTEGHTYELVADVPSEKIQATARFIMPDRSFLKKRVAIDESVPSPWHAVKDLGKGRFLVLDRTYAFAKGPFPSQIVSRGRAVFVQSPELTIDGKGVAWKGVRVKAAHPDRVELVSAGSCGELTFEACGELWFDGFLKLTLDMKPGAKPITIAAMKLSWSVPADCSRYLLGPHFIPWQKGGGYEGSFGPDDQALSLVWLTGVESGVAWWGESEANWVPNGRKPNIHVVRTAHGADVTLDIIAQTAKLGKTARYVMGWQGTPNKRPDYAYRSEHSGPGGSWTSCGWGSFVGKHQVENFRHVTSFIPEHPEEFRRYLADQKHSKLGVLVYGMPMHISPLDDVWDYYNATWRRSAGTRWDFTDETTKKKSHVDPCCGFTGAAEWQLNNIDNLFSEYPDLLGLYYDISSIHSCANQAHGHGGTDAFGRTYETSIALGFRDYFMRVVKLCRKYNKKVHVHAHNKYYPFVHSLADACWPGEEQYSPFCRNPRTHYLEGISEEEYQAGLNTAIHGLGIHSIQQNARAYSLQPETVKRDFEGFLGRDAIFASVLPALIYDFNVKGNFEKWRAPLDETRKALAPLKLNLATFHGAWYDPAAQVAEGIRTALYTWKTGEGTVPYLLVVGNFTQQNKETALKPDWSKLGAPCKLCDLMTGHTLSAEDWATTSLRAGNYLLLVPEK